MAKKITVTDIKRSPKGAVSVYGLGRFPVSMYREQWLALLDRAEDIRAFIEKNKAELPPVGDSWIDKPEGGGGDKN